jgi:Domain of unknown function (DUF4062)
MPKGYPPSVFVSSTCYDLNQVRADLRRFLEGMGFDAILSETPAFPVNPQISPVENCLRAVKERADIFVLIVGARYGSQNESGRSITNLEYVARRLAEIRKALLEWSIEFNRTEVRPECERLFSLLSNSSQDFIKQLESLPTTLDSETAKAIEAHKRGEEYAARVMLKVSVSNEAELHAEFERLSNLVGN